MYCDYNKFCNNFQKINHLLALKSSLVGGGHGAGLLGSSLPSSGGLSNSGGGGAVAEAEASAGFDTDTTTEAVCTYNKVKCIRYTIHNTALNQMLPTLQNISKNISYIYNRFQWHASL